MHTSLAGRLNRVAGKQTLRLTHWGRVTGKPHEVTIYFTTGGGKVYLATANVNRQWVRNVKKTPQVKLSVAGETFDGQARFLDDRAEHDLVMARVRKKYWLFRPMMELGRLLTKLGIGQDNSGAFEVILNP